MERVGSVVLENPIIIVFVGMILVGILVMVVPVLFKKNDNNEIKKPLNVKKDLVSLDNLEELKKDIFQLYKDVEIAKMKFRFGVLEEKLENSLYVVCEKELKSFKEQGQKYVSTDITLEDIRILSRSLKNNIEKFEVFLHVSQYDYVIDKSKKVVRGTEDDRYQIEYKMIVEKDLNTNCYRICKRECVGKWIKK